MPITDDFSIGSPANGTAITAYNSGLWAYTMGAAADVEIQTNRVAIGVVGTDLLVRRTDGTFPNDQYAQVTIGVAMASQEWMGVGARLQSATSGGYGFFSGNSAPETFKWVAGSFTPLGSAGSRASTAGDKYKLTVTGGSAPYTIAPQIDQGSGFSSTGTPGNQSDSSFASGYPGLSGYNGNQPVSVGRLDDFECSDLDGGTPASLSHLFLLLGVGR